MPAKWVDVPIDKKWFANVAETALTSAQAAMENCFLTEAGGHSRFPGLEEFAALEDSGRVYLHDWRGDLVASTSMGNFYRIDKNGNVTNCTGTPLSGRSRTVFAKTTDELVMAAGGPLIRFAGAQTEVLSEDAPNADFVAFVDNYLVANEIRSGRFYHSEAGQGRSWNPLDVFAADSKPDNIVSLLVTPFRELILCGADSTEQFDRLTSGDTPFFRRWSVGEGISVPHSVVATDNGVWGINAQQEFIRFSGQASEPRGDDIGQVLEGVDDWTDAWAGGYPDRSLNVLGQKFILLQAPFATNPYGTKGLTLLYDYRQRRWASLYGWDADAGLPARWPGWSYWPKWGNTYVGGEGKVYRLTTSTYTNDGAVQRMLGRTAHLSKMGHIRIDRMRTRLRRGVGTNTAESTFLLRANRDNHGFGRWLSKGLGKAGQRNMVVEFGAMGQAHTWQFEWMVTDDCPVEFVSMEAMVTRLGR